MGERWREIADGVYVRRHVFLDQNIGLVVGDGACLVVDTRATLADAGDLIEAVRTVTAAPWTVVNTHTHWDHYFGNAAFRPADIWAHRNAAEWATRYGQAQRAGLLAQVRGRADRADFAAGLRAVPLDPPDRTFEDSVTLDVGGTAVTLQYLGRGHTDGDIVLRTGAVLFAGDLVEEGGPVQCGDSFPLDWPATLAAMLPLVTGPVVPGHGDVVDRAYVAGQRAELAAVADLARQAHAAGVSAPDLARDLPLPPDQAALAADRAYRQLDGRPGYDPPEVAPGGGGPG
jgi:glyoxylase-like metal-dependent hydrolase (beta-lactamase superfamily II)